MQRLFFEKQIDLGHALQELISISVNENLVYRDDLDGKRVVGTLEINGEYLRLASRERFNDQIEIDILAPFNRLEENEKFYLEVQDFDYHIQNGNLKLEIQILVHGVCEKNERYINVDGSDDEQALLKEIQNIVSKQELSSAIEKKTDSDSNQQQIENREEEINLETLNEMENSQDDHPKEELLEIKKDEEDNIEEVECEQTKDEVFREQNQMEESEITIELTQEKMASELRPEEILLSGSEETSLKEYQNHESIDVEDLFDDSIMAFVTYPIYVVKAGDSYEKIALQYQLDVEKLMEYNQYVSLKPHQLLVIPPR